MTFDTVISPVAIRYSFGLPQKQDLHTRTVSVIDSERKLPAAASEEVTTAPSEGVMPDGLSIMILAPMAVVPVCAAVIETFTRYVPCEKSSMALLSSFMLQPHTLDIERGMVCPVVRVTVFVLKNFPAIAYSLCGESVATATATAERIASRIPCGGHRIADYSAECLVELELADLVLHLCNPVALDDVQDLLCVLAIFKFQGVDSPLSGAAAVSQL